MLKLFRKVRSNFLSSNSLSKYLLYAVGEILLVVIGILIALQVNKWNERNINHQTEISLLSNLYEDLNKDIDNLSWKIKVDSFVSFSNKDLHRDLNNGDIVNATLQRTFNNSLEYNRLGAINRVYFFNPQRFAYESIKLKGIDIITDAALRQRIVTLYDYSYPRTLDYIQVQFDMLVDSNRYLWRHLESRSGLYFKYPRDPEALINDGEFVNFVSHMSFEYDQAIVFYKRNLNELKSLIREVAKEIETIKH